MLWYMLAIMGFAPPAVDTFVAIALQLPGLNPADLDVPQISQFVAESEKVSVS